MCVCVCILGSSEGLEEENGVLRLQNEHDIYDSGTSRPLIGREDPRLTLRSLGWGLAGLCGQSRTLYYLGSRSGRIENR